MSNEVINVDQVWLDATGNPLENGTLTFNVNLTTTLDTIFSDEALTVAQANPYPLDAAGRTLGDVKYTGLKRVISKDESGATIRTYDNVASMVDIDDAVSTVKSFNTVALAKAEDDLTNHIGGLVRIASQDTTISIDSLYEINAGNATDDNGSVHNSDTLNAFWLGWMPRNLEVLTSVFGTSGDDTNDDWQALTNAIAFAGTNFIPVRVPDGRFKVTQTLVIPPGMRFMGSGRWSTAIIADSTLTGAVIGDNGTSSAKTILQGFEVDGSGASGCTSLISMGLGATPLGSEGFFDEILLRGGAAPGATNPIGLDIVGNVFFITKVTSWWCSTAFKEGPNSVFISYINCVALGDYDVAYDVNTGAKLTNCEIEAPNSTAIGVKILRTCEINALTYSPADSTANTFVIEVNSGAFSYHVNGLTINNSSGGSLTGMVNDKRAAFEDILDTTVSVYHSVSERLRLTTVDFFVNQRKFQFYELFLNNNGGTIEHLIGSTNEPGLASVYDSEIVGATRFATTTPLGTDATTAFATGCKIGSASPHLFIMDTVVETNDTTMICSISRTNITNLHASASSTNIDINGTTENWVAISFYDASAGANFNLATMASGKFIKVAVFALL